MSKRLFKNIQHTAKKNLIDGIGHTIWIYLKKTNSKGSSYDPFRNTGYTKTEQSPIPIKVNVRVLSPDSLIRREIGLAKIGAIEIQVDECSANIIKIAEKIKYNNELYATYNKAVGNQVQITTNEYGISRIILFKLGN